MILETLKIFGLFVLAAAILPLCFLALRDFARSKRGVIDGMAQLDAATLRQLGWMPKGYIALFDLRGPVRSGWQAWRLMSQQQNAALHRVLLHGLPKPVEIPDETRKSALRYRCYLSAFTLFAVACLVPFLIGLSRSIAEFTGIPTAIWGVLFCFGIGSLIILPAEKFRKWPEIEERA